MGIWGFVVVGVKIEVKVEKKKEVFIKVQGEKKELQMVLGEIIVEVKVFIIIYIFFSKICYNVSEVVYKS